MPKVSKKLRVLVITPALNLCGGIESYAMSYYRELHEKIDFDFVTHEISDSDYRTEIEKNGDHVYLLRPISGKNIAKNRREINAFFEEHHDYDIVHCHMANAAFLYLKAAKAYGIKVRIIHSHNNKYADTLTHALRNVPLVKAGRRHCTHRLACSEAAGKFLFKNAPFDIIKNAIDAEAFAYSPKIRAKYRKELGAEDCFVIGNVGRLVSVKNQKFLIKIFDQIHRQIKNSKLIIIGDGPLEQDLKRLAKTLRLEKAVIFLPSQNNVHDYLQAFDLFIFPSHYEGLGIVNIEAQAAGLHVIASTATPYEAKITNLIEFLPLNLSAEAWARAVNKYSSGYERKQTIEQVTKHGYDAKTSADNLLTLYSSYLRGQDA